MANQGWLPYFLPIFRTYPQYTRAQTAPCTLGVPPDKKKAPKGLFP